ncbi:HIT-like domain-containing protein [Talaromyces proteolyticus]|uniref:Aprataxin-like protein n=1 Tax=Talaromyces proteolyticus TaxID=1131652 RepID=A0AAD4KQ38_9EURO|nr:HIT-like domain-containing protein [Talaromyces proteolyticus]KAH8696670.1 HIT-like domain-containing protein [Talaromyces proteolyticus]
MGDNISGSDASDVEVPGSEASGETVAAAPEGTLREVVKRNAFAELMSPKTKQQKLTAPSKATTLTKTKGSRFGMRDGLGAYLKHPESYPPSTVVYYNDDFVAIYDLYPKSSLHLLLLPRDSSKFYMHPFDAFEDTEFLQKVQTEVKKLRKLAAGELRRIYGKFSEQEKARREVMEQEEPSADLPPGRDWEKEIMTGIHARPSMSHLHIHVMSVDRYSDRLKHRKHYNSFATPFFVNIDDFPLARNDPRRHPGREAYLQRDFICWRCSRNFGNKFQQLKDHLAEEFEQWKRL